jgi:hypothetical protein
MVQNNFIGTILCFLGIHKWGKKFGHDEIRSNVIDWKKRCIRCGKLKQWVAAKSEDYGTRRKRTKDYFKKNRF